MTTARLQRVSPGLLAGWLLVGVRNSERDRWIGMREIKGGVFEWRLLLCVSGRNRTLLLEKVSGAGLESRHLHVLVVSRLRENSFLPPNEAGDKHLRINLCTLHLRCFSRCFSAPQRNH